MRAVSNSLLAALVVAALFWGNCFSCPELLLSLVNKAPHSCCQRHAPRAHACTTNALQHFVKADPVAVAAPAAAAPACVAMFTPAPAAQPMPAAAVPLPSPPDLPELNSILRV